MIQIDEKKVKTFRRSFVQGIFHGAGAVVGGIIALSLLGWILWLLGVIPGFNDFEGYLNSVISTYEHRI